MQEDYSQFVLDVTFEKIPMFRCRLYVYRYPNELHKQDLLCRDDK